MMLCALVTTVICVFAFFIVGSMMMFENLTLITSFLFFCLPFRVACVPCDASLSSSPLLASVASEHDVIALRLIDMLCLSCLDDGCFCV